jgi:hypothetical protein
LKKRSLSKFPNSILNLLSDPQGFNLTYDSTDCGGIVRGPLSVITSPAFPALYPSNVDCAWLLNFEEGQQIEVNDVTVLSTFENNLS